MALTQLPAPVKFYRQSNGHYYVWDGCFTTPLYDLNDPSLGLGTAINEVFGDTLTAITVVSADDSYFVSFQNFLLASRQALVQQVADAVNSGP
jgi:hypothetical protein